jgi:hypothetical protein
MLSANASVGASSFPLHWSNNGAQQVLLPHSALPAGHTITVDASASPAHWLTWLWGNRLSAKTTVKVPAVTLTRTTEAVSTGNKLQADFSQPVSVVEWTLGGHRHTMHLQPPSAKVAIGSPLPQGVSGSVQIRAAVHSWTELSKPETLSFFAGSGTLMTASPAPGGFLASAGASAAYLTVSEAFPLEIRARAIALFYALGTATGGVLAPTLFAILIASGARAQVFWGYLLAAILMLLAAAAEIVWGFAAEGRSLEALATPLSFTPIEASPALARDPATDCADTPPPAPEPGRPPPTP